MSRRYSPAHSGQILNRSCSIMASTSHGRPRTNYQGTRRKSLAGFSRLLPETLPLESTLHDVSGCHPQRERRPRARVRPGALQAVSARVPSGNGTEIHARPIDETLAGALCHELPVEAADLRAVVSENGLLA